MNIFVNSFGIKCQRTALALLSQKIDINNLYISKETNTENIKAKKIITFDRNTIPGWWQEDVAESIVINTNVLNDLKHTEADFFYLLERYKPFFHYKGFPKNMDGEKLNKALFNKYYNPYYTPSEGKRLYHILLNKWLSFFLDNPVDLYITSHIPHEPQRYLVYRIVKYLKIRTIMLGFTPIPGRVLIYSDFKENNPEIKKTYEDNILKEKIQLSDEMKKIYNEKTKPIDQQKGLFYMEKGFFQNNPFATLKAESILTGFIKKIRQLADVDFLYLKIKGVYTDKYYKKSTNFLSDHKRNISDLPENFFYFPLHVQPELTTFPKGGDFTDQLLIIDYVVSYLPKNYYIVVKEHPNQAIRGRRSLLFYQELINNSKIFIASTETNSKKLTKKSKGVISIAGTVLWEALFLKKPGLMFGYHLNMFLPNVFPIRTLRDCKNAVNNIINNDFRITENNIKAILAAIQEHSVEAVMDGIMQKGTHISEQQCAENLSKEIIKKVKK
ncbi:MAG: hypothetical protein U9Q83_09630 [Bacteroidota bacterium]|nr:hypothetical protein [Bacteroidota bacterium]